MVARNFLEVNPNIFYPRVDFAGDKTGITGMEFPILNYLIYLVSLFFGYEHWYGRLINLIISTIGLHFFYKLINNYFSSRIAFNSTIILMCSIWFAYSRKIMPDTFSMSLIIAGCYYGTNYFDRGLKIKDLALYAILTLTGILAKLPCGFILVLYSMFLFSKNYSFRSKLIFGLISTIIIIVTSVWYFYWVPKLVRDFGFWHFFMGNSIIESIKAISSSLPLALEKFYFDALKFIGFAIFLFGLFQVVKQKNKRLAIVFSLTFISFLVVILKAGNTFSHHSYYIIPFVPVMALLCGYGIEQIKYKRIGIILLIAIAAEGILNQQHDFQNNRNIDLLTLEKDLDSISNRNDLILINSGQFPTPIYFAHRKGWINYNYRIEKPEYINKLEQRGLKYIVILKRCFGSYVFLKYKVVFENESYIIYKI